MNRPDQPESTTQSDNRVDEAPSTQTISKPASFSTAHRFDWLALGVVILIAAFFASTARLHAQPATSFVPVAVLSATGCGLLVTALRKLRTPQGVGLFAAALGGFFVALFQFLVALTYPGVFDTLSAGGPLSGAFLSTWGLVTGFAILFSAAGAVLGHLAFAPLRPLPPARPSPKAMLFVTILLLGLAPTVVAYVFSAAFDFMLGLNQIIPGPYPTLRLLSTLLPWQIPLPINVSANIGNIIIFSLLWRIPLFLGNPTPFDLQALEAFAFNGTALALLLLAMHHHNTGTTRPGWPVYLLLEAALGLVLILPADLWVFQGLKGLLQLPAIIVPIRTLSVLDPLTFSLNLITGPLVCIAIGGVLRMLLNKRTRMS